MKLMGYAIGMLTAYILILLAMYLFQRHLLYYPPKDRPQLGGYAAAGVEELDVQTADGLSLRHWYRPPHDNPAPVVVIFHGNAGHIGDRIGKYFSFIPKDYGVFFASYRGYGGNPGSPAEGPMTSDAAGIIGHLIASGIAPERIVLYGESLGTGVATKMAARFPVAGLVLEAPPGSIADVAQHHYWWLPAKWLTRDPWNVLPLIAEIDTPLLIIHGDKDRTVPQKFGRRVFAAANEPKQSVFAKGAGHNNLLDHPEVGEALQSFLRQRAKRGTELPATQ